MIPVNETYVMIWIVLLVILVLVELLTMGLTTIWFAGGSLVGLLLAVFGLPLWAQIIAALVVSIILLLTTRPIAVKYFNKDRVRTNAESLIGHIAIVMSEIDNIQGVGLVNVGGQEWTARSYDDSVTIPSGSVVEILSISGVKLIVRPSVGHQTET
ncbi:MAG: NfeD family protein [Lachnospiraceae bacterium]|nr:NfeD family protein [Lachnospiraceae bacterium]